MKKNLFDISSDIELLKISTKNFEFISESIEEFEIKFNSNELVIESILTVSEKSDFLNSFKTFSPEDNIVTIYIKDKRTNPKTKTNGVFQRDFIITQISEVKDENSRNKAHTIKMIDAVSYTLKNTFYSKGYQNILYSEIVKDIFSVFKIPNLIPKDYEIKISASLDYHDFFVIPNNTNLYDFLMYQAAQDGCILYQDRGGIYLIHISELYSNNINKVDANKTFLQDTSDNSYEFKAIEVVSNFSNNHDNLEFPKTNTFVYDPLTKSILQKKQNFDEIYDKINFNSSKETYIQNSSGYFYDVAEVGLSDFSLIRNTYFNYLKNNTLDIVTPGTLYGNRLLELRDVKIIGSTSVEDGLRKGNETLNGNYIVLSISDKILNNKYIQNIILGRVNNTAKSEVKA